MTGDFPRACTFFSSGGANPIHNLSQFALFVEDGRNYFGVEAGFKTTVQHVIVEQRHIPNFKLYWSR
jgi:hypothetical protein